MVKRLAACGLLLLISWLAPCTHLSTAWASPGNQKESRSLISEALHDAIPNAFVPTQFTEADFVLEWDSAPIAGVRFEIEKNSLQWSRVAELIVLPRARVLIETLDISSGQVAYAEFIQPLSHVSKSRWNALVPVVLVSGSENPIEIRLMKQGKLVTGKLRIRFHPKPNSVFERIVIDPSCSKFKVSFQSKNPSTDEWLYIGCRSVVEKGESHRSSILELYLFWDNVGSEIDFGSMKLPSSGNSLWKIRAPANESQTSLKTGAHELKIEYHTPDYFHLGFLGLGLGPYANTFVNGAQTNTSGIAPVLTVYGSYIFSEGVRAVAFDATTINANAYSDLGFYFNFENSRFLDRRVIVNLLIGGHAIAFQNQASTYLKFGAPQGIELTYIDFLKPGYNATAGAFIYPSISGTEYYNAWLRWGSSIFVEFNYIEWKFPVQDNTISSRSAGFSIGFPITSFL